MDPEEQEVDGTDESDDLAVEAAIAAAIAEQFSSAPNFGPGDLTERIGDILDVTVGPLLRAYILRVIGRMLSQAGSSPALYSAIDWITAQAYEETLAETAESVVEILRDPDNVPRRAPASNFIPYATSAPTSETLNPGLPSGPRIVANPQGDLGYVQEIDPNGDVEAYRRLGLALRTASRVTATNARETAKAGMAFRLGATGKVWRTRRDDRVRVSHADLEGEFQPIDGVFVTVAGASLRRPGDPLAPIGEIINCVPGETPVKPIGKAQVIYRARWGGGLFDVRLKSGHVLTGTPNHPVLTEEGWVGLSELQPGQHLIRVEDGVPGGPNDQGGHPSVGEVFDFARKAGAPQWVAGGGGFNFHGDRPDGDVDVVFVDGLLEFDRISLPGEVVRQFQFSPADRAAPAGGPSSGPILSLTGGSEHSLYSCCSDAGVAEVAGSVSPGSRKGVGFRVGSETNPGLRESPLDSGPRNPIMLGQPVDAFPERVGSDEVLGVEFRDWSGHVYTLQTETGCYTDSITGVVQRNCRCRLSYRIPVNP